MFFSVTCFQDLRYFLSCFSFWHPCQLSHPPSLPLATHSGKITIVIAFSLWSVKMTKNVCNLLSATPVTKEPMWGIPWWSSGGQSACQCRQHRWPLVWEDSTCCRVNSAHVPQLLSPCSATRSHHKEKPMPHTSRVAPTPPTREKPMHSNKDLRQPKKFF